MGPTVGPGMKIVQHPSNRSLPPTSSIDLFLDLNFFSMKWTNLNMKHPITRYLTFRLSKVV